MTTMTTTIDFFSKGREALHPFFRTASISLLAVGLAGIGEPAEARITKIQINSRAIAFAGQSFGSVGQYETLRGVAWAEVDPDDPLNEVITDIKLAPGVAERGGLHVITPRLGLPVVPRTIESSTTTIRLPAITSRSGFSFSLMPSCRMVWLGWMKVRPT